MKYQSLGLVNSRIIPRDENYYCKRLGIRVQGTDSSLISIDKWEENLAAEVNSINEGKFLEFSMSKPGNTKMLIKFSLDYQASLNIERPSGEKFSFSLQDFLQNSQDPKVAKITFKNQWRLYDSRYRRNDFTESFAFYCKTRNVNLSILLLGISSK